MTIPKRLVRTVPQSTSVEAEYYWDQACRLHPDWEHVTWRDPIDRQWFPLTSQYWDSCESGAQLSDLIRAEDLFARGGVYIDSDVECYRPFDSLLGLDGFAAYEDPDHICTAVIGFRSGHPALGELIQGGIERHTQGGWLASIGVASEYWPKRNDLTLLPPGSFYPYHYRHKNWVNLQEVRQDNPWAYCAHHWAFSWEPTR